MIPAIEHRFFSTLTIAGVAVVAMLVVVYGLDAVLMLSPAAGELPGCGIRFRTHRSRRDEIV
jgi:hypothetical protein